jgi:hypothetical protein
MFVDRRKRRASFRAVFLSTLRALQKITAYLTENRNPSRRVKAPAVVSLSTMPILSVLKEAEADPQRSSGETFVGLASALEAILVKMEWTFRYRRLVCGVIRTAL